MFPIHTFFLLLFFPSTSPLSFDMSPITTSDGGRLDFVGTAYLSPDGIQVTTNERDKALSSIAGRATYKQPLHLWDKSSQKVVDFSSNFSFVIDSNESYNFGDGMAFFLAPNVSSLKNDTYGGGLGLGYGRTPPEMNSSSSAAFVAIEFDTFPVNPFDPPRNGSGGAPHVGVDINNMSSVATATWTWLNSIYYGVESDARIRYNGTTKMLTVNFETRSIRTNRTQRGNLSYEVDLRDHLPEYVIVGFSAATGASFEKHTVQSWNFSSSDLVINEITNGGNNKGLLIVGLSVGLPILILALALAMYVLWKRKKKHMGLADHDESFSDSSMDNELETDTGPKKFTYEELAFATDNFDEELKLGEGGFGAVYRGLLRATNTYIAVKKVSKGSKQGRKEYAAEVKIISQLRHMNLVQLMGWCHQRAELLLVYEFMPNKSLDSHLFKVNSPLTWEMRYKIAQGLASALLYLHEELRQYVVHRDIKASNIMLDANFNSKLGDFGLARLVDHDKDSRTTVPAGTIGYMAPEYPVTGRASKETDIYSFGIVLLEIACGRRPIDHRNLLDRVVLVEWVWSLYGGGQLLDAADPKLDSSEHDVGKIECLMVVGLWCVHPDSSQRPSIRQVIQVLNFEVPLPDLPQAIPRAVYNNNPRVVTVSYSSNTQQSSGAFSTDSTSYGQGSNSSYLTTSSAGSTSDLLPN
ncbi:hypothetical protein C2S53_002501 [Perilla frutescens var. hirtella]|uniref:Protein kinase domain-containing protein n=1 Tax=Perilla frutescens var. hirtella TaxID=608512 RepID=A0AAD4J5S2_PERFH|nr:hypothetical protein C2S53_002501 [Perilla frutescens var. hirtella]